MGHPYNFFPCKQRQGETIEEFSKQLKFLASQCEFNQTVTLDRLLRDVFVAGLNSAPVLSSVMQSADSMSFNEAIEKAKFVQQIREDTADMQSTARVNATQDLHDNDSFSINKVQQRKIPANYICARCGAKARHFVDKCFALKLRCNKCSKEGHIAAVCRSSRSSSDLHSVQPDHVTSELHHISRAVAPANLVPQCRYQLQLSAPLLNQ